MKYWDMVWGTSPPMPAQIHAELTLAWLRKSGPTYTDATLKLFGRSSDFVILEWPASGVSQAYSRGQMSYASWLATRQAKIGDTLALRLRTDPVANGK